MKRNRNIRFAALSAVSAVLFLLAWENTQATKLGYSIERLRRDNRDIENTNRYLKKEIQTTLSPEKLEAEAMRLGMVYPEPSSIVLLDGNSSQPGHGLGWFARLLRRDRTAG